MSSLLVDMFVCSQTSLACQYMYTCSSGSNHNCATHVHAYKTSAVQSAVKVDLIRLSSLTSGGCEPLVYTIIIVQYCTCTIFVQAKPLAEMAARYKLIYFNARGGAEFIRLIFAQAAVEYQDVRIEGEQWPHLKLQMPFGVVPVLEVDGKLLGGSVVIGRYLAEQFGLGGDSDLENAQIAAIVDAA